MKLRLGALGLVALATLGTACGDGASTVTAKPVDVLALVASKTSSAGTVRTVMTMSMTAGGQSFDMTGSGAFDMAARTGQMTMDLGALGGTMEMVMQPETLFVKLPAGFPGAAPGKPWVKIDMAKFGEKAGINFSQLTNQDPTKSLEYLSGISGEITVVGREDVRGEATTHYTTTIDLDKAIEANPAAAEALKTAKTVMGDKPFPVEVWVDDAGRMRKMLQDVDIAAQGQTAHMTMTIEMFDFGTPVTITVPPASQVGDGSALFGG